jgi:predicted flavoprotein YhiN
VVDSELESVQARLGKRILAKTPVLQIPSRLWGRLTGAAGIGADARWQSLSRAARCSLVRQICRTELFVSGKSLNKEEFVTCGGARLDQVDFRTMQSRITPGLFFAGELLDIDGITGGYNFQAAWTTGWIAGNAMAEWLPSECFAPGPEK